MKPDPSMRSAFIAVLWDHITDNRTLSMVDELSKHDENDRDDVAMEYDNAICAAADALGISTHIDNMSTLHDWADSEWPAIAEFLTEDDQ